MSGETRCDCGHTHAGDICHAYGCACEDFRPASPPPPVTGEAVTGERLAELLYNARRNCARLTLSETKSVLAELSRLRASGTADERLREAAGRFARWLRDGFDHEADAHRYDNGACRRCRAEEFLAEISRASLPSEREGQR
jgi:hypothetical protein